MKFVRAVYWRPVASKTLKVNKWKLWNTAEKRLLVSCLNLCLSCRLPWQFTLAKPKPPCLLFLFPCPVTLCNTFVFCGEQLWILLRVVKWKQLDYHWAEGFLLHCFPASFFKILIAYSFHSYYIWSCGSSSCLFFSFFLFLLACGNATVYTFNWGIYTQNVAKFSCFL